MGILVLLMILMIPPPTLHSYISKVRREQNTESTGLAEFFQEPKLGTSWYNPNGPEPTFDMAQANGTIYTSQLGADVFMSCKVIIDFIVCIGILRSIQFYNFWYFSSTTVGLKKFWLQSLVNGLFCGQIKSF